MNNFGIFDKITHSDWNKRFMELADFISKWSRDPSTKVGAVITDKNHRIISTGYNGFAKGVKDLEDRYFDRDIKYKMVLHAEENAIMFAKQRLDDCEIFVTKLPPCSHCAALIIQSGIKDVHMQDIEIPERWKTSFNMTKKMFSEAGVKLHTVHINNYKDKLPLT